MSRKILFSLSCQFYLLSLFIFPAFSSAESVTGIEPAGTEVSGPKIRKSTDMEEMLLFFEEKDLIVTATKHPQRLQEAPAIATVITADEIKKMGARDLVDVLKTLPGIGITKGYFGLEEIEVRGIKTVYSEKVKLLIDGHSVNTNANGNATWAFGDLALDNVKRLEVIRGPGSALYGSSAFSGVINVITKDGKDIDGVIVSGGGGSFDTSKVNILAGKSVSDLDVAFSMDYLYTNGARLKINSDSVNKSGNTDDFKDKIDLDLKLAYKDWGFHSKYIAKKRGPYLGATYALNDESEVDLWQYFGELSCKNDINENTVINAKAYVDELKWDAFWKLYSENAVPPPFSFLGPWPNGMKANPSLRERSLGAEFQIDYKLSGANQLTFGLVGEEKKQFDIAYKTNYNPLTFVPFPSGSVQDVSATGNWNQEKIMDIWAVYIQDVWDIASNAGLTLGIRHDNYSDFGATTNPRAALVWKYLEGWDAKFLYGTAFRAPSYVELYNINNPSVLGNPDLKAETMETYEVSIGYESKSDTRARITYFNNIIKDMIQLDPPTAPSTFVNKGGARVQGIEAEIKKDFKKDAYIYTNYTYQWPKDDETGKRLPDVPTHKGNLGGNVGLTKYLNANLNIFASWERPRVDGDPRDAVPAYALVDLTFIAKNFYRDLELRASAHNLLDKKYADSAPIQDDLPREGASMMIEALYRF